MTHGKIALTVDELALELGISRSAAYELIKRDDFPSVRISGRRVIIPVDKLREWLNKQTES